MPIGKLSSGVGSMLEGAKRSGSNHRYIMNHMCAGAKAFMLLMFNPASSKVMWLVPAPSTL